MTPLNRIPTLSTYTICENELTLETVVLLLSINLSNDIRHVDESTQLP